MNLPRYKFSEEVKQDLADFLKISQNNDVNSSDTIWQHILPRNLGLIDELKEIINEKKEEVVAVIDLTEEVNQKMSDTLVEDIEMDLMKAVTEDNLNTTSIKDLVDSIKENLNTEYYLSDDIIKGISNLPTRDVDDMFTLFHDCLSLELISKLGNSIIKSSLENLQIVTCYIKLLLLPKFFSEYDKQLEVLFSSFLEIYLNITSEEFAIKISEITSCPKYVQDKLNALEPKYKQKLLREFVSNASKLTQAHFPIIEALLPKDLNVETVKKLVELISTVSTTFSADKAFGKLLLSVLKCSANHSHLFQQQWTSIIGLHQSVLKNKLQKQMRDCFASHSRSMMSQSLRY